MSICIHAGPRGKETHDDWMMRIVHDSFLGTGRERALARLTLTLEAFMELDMPSRPDEGAPLVKRRTEYRCKESITRDITFCNYGGVPTTFANFYALDTVVVRGEVSGKKIGIALDFHHQQLKPTQTKAWIEGEKEGGIGNLANHIYTTMASHNLPGKYTPGNEERGSIILSSLGIPEIVNGAMVPGTLSFGGRSQEQHKLARAFVQAIRAQPNFTEEAWVIQSYRVPTEGNKLKGDHIPEEIDRIHTHMLEAYQHKALMQEAA